MSPVHRVIAHPSPSCTAALNLVSIQEGLDSAKLVVGFGICQFVFYPGFGDNVIVTEKVLALVAHAIITCHDVCTVENVWLTDL